MSTKTARITPLAKTEGAQKDLGERWQSLQREASGSFFTSWPWISTLINCSANPLWLFSLETHGSDVALALLGEGPRHGPLGAHRFLFLNLSGDRDENQIYPEYNDILCLPGTEDQATRALLEALMSSESPTPWSGLTLNGMTEAAVSRWSSAFAAQPHMTNQSNAPFIGLEHMPDGEDYLRSLSSNTRSQIRRSIRLFENTYGKLTTTPLKDASLQVDALKDLGALQQKKLSERGEVSAFESPFFQNFLQSLLTRFPSEEDQHDMRPGVELLKIEAGETCLGYLYNLHHKGTVSNYQCAFTTFSDNRMKPGLVAHTLAVQHYMSKGQQIYHLLAGNQQYKQSLAKQSDTLYWLELHKPDTRLAIESFARGLKMKLRQRRPQ